MSGLASSSARKWFRMVNYSNIKSFTDTLICQDCNACLYSPNYELKVVAHLEQCLTACCGTVLVYHFLLMLIGEYDSIYGGIYGGIYEYDDR